MKSIGIYYNPLHFTDRSKISKKIKYLRDCGLNVFLLDEQKDAIFSNITYVKKFLRRQIDSVIVFGGDGTMLAIARKILFEGIPLLGFNYGKLGFLSECNKNEFIQIIDKLIHKNYSIEKRDALYCKVNNDQYYAINDIVLSKGNYPKLIGINIYQNNDYLYMLRGDGVIIATPIGSTAYSLSAGGSILHPDCKNFIVTPINPHNQFSKPVVFSSDSNFEIKLESNVKCWLSIDGENTCRVSQLDKINIEKSKYQSYFIKFKNKNFLRILRKKFTLE
ncbi:MAG: NAD(+)/NADH kinase [Candidatus Cloacimonadota bacterium]|nr:NAD(+)/NADH kinase [Candidatus Cloacimonadota bacterium]